MSFTSEWNEFLKIEEKHLTPSAIRRLKIAIIAAIPIIPTTAGFDLTSKGSPLIWSLMVIAAIVTSLFATFYAFINPISNTLVKNDKDLDEWGLAHKITAQSFSFKLTIGLLSVLWVMAVATSFLPQFSQVRFNLSVYDVGSLMLSVMFFLWFTSTAHIAWTIRPIDLEDGRAVLEDKAIKTAREQKVEAAIIMVVVVLMLLAILAGLFAWGWMDAHHAAGH